MPIIDVQAFLTTLQAVPEANPVTLITAEVMRRLQDPDFKPFAFHMSDGRSIAVPSRDHCFVTPLLRRIEVETSEPNVRIFLINPLHVASIEDAA
jgi:hypothetical protein